MSVTRDLDIRLGPFVFRAVLETSRPWGLKRRNGTVAPLAWCWGQSESPDRFLHFRLLVLGPVGMAFGRIVQVR